MCDPSSVQHELEFGSFESYYLTWYDGSYGDGEPLPFNQDRLYEDNSFCANEEQEDSHSTNTSYGDELPLPYNGGMNSWLAEFKSYFVGSWGDDVVPSYVNCPEKSDDHERQVSETARTDSWDEMRLVEGIFGHWSKLDLEDQTEPAVA